MRAKRAVSLFEQRDAATLLLTPAEVQILKLMAQGYSSEGIAEIRGVEPRTVGFHIQNIYMKLGVTRGDRKINCRVVALNVARERGYLKELNDGK